MFTDESILTYQPAIFNIIMSYVDSEDYNNDVYYKAIEIIVNKLLTGSNLGVFSSGIVEGVETIDSTSLEDMTESTIEHLEHTDTNVGTEPIAFNEDIIVIVECLIKGIIPLTRLNPTEHFSISLRHNGYVVLTPYY